MRNFQTSSFPRAIRKLMSPFFQDATSDNLFVFSIFCSLTTRGAILQIEIILKLANFIIRTQYATSMPKKFRILTNVLNLLQKFYQFFDFSFFTNSNDLLKYIPRKCLCKFKKKIIWYFFFKLKVIYKIKIFLCSAKS